MTPTTFENRCLILADLWLNYRDEPQFAEFIKYNDLGLPLAYAIAEGIVETTELSSKFINETFDLFVSGYDIDDNDFLSLSDIIDRGDG